jgi:hypothetical protein
LVYTNSDGFFGGSRFYISYAGGSPTPANCVTLATDIATAWNANLAPQVNAEWSLTEVDVQDITTLTGASGLAAVDHPGTASSDAPTSNTATNIEFNIARRYRGGKPRMFLPPGGNDDLGNQSKWSDDYITATNAAITAFYAAIAALSVGAMGVLAHVSLSYYSSFTNVTNSSGRTRAAPKYRDTAIVDLVTGYATKATVGSQRRRRTATTP